MTDMIQVIYGPGSPNTTLIKNIAFKLTEIGWVENPWSGSEQYNQFVFHVSM